MIKDGKCSFCGSAPKRKTYTALQQYVDKIGNIQTVDPEQIMEYVHYECKCGCRYTTYEVEENPNQASPAYK